MKLKSLLETKKKDHFYIMHLSYDGTKKKRLWDYAIENNIIGLDHREAYKQNWIKMSESVKNRISRIWIRQLDTFCNELEKDDIIVVLDGWYHILGISEIIGKYNHDKNLSGFSEGDFFGHTRQILEWRKVYEYGVRLLPDPVYGFNNTLSKVDKNKKWWTSLVKLEV